VPGNGTQQRSRRVDTPVKPVKPSSVKTGHPQRRLDPHAPLVLDTRELGRRPGSMREVRRTVPAPAQLGIEGVIGVPVGADLALDLRLESVMEGVLVSGEVTAPLEGECGRCLEPVSDTVVVEVQELFAYEASTSDETTDEDELPRMEGDHLDLEPAVRDAVVLALPLTPLCDEDCAGLCVDCGERLDDLPEDHSHDAVDARWAALASLSSPDATTADPTTRTEEQ
jgi:uncharacterized protein